MVPPERGICVITTSGRPIAADLTQLSANFAFANGKNRSIVVGGGGGNAAASSFTAADSLKIVLFLGHDGHLRNFEPAIRGLSERGHTVQIALSQRRAPLMTA